MPLTAAVAVVAGLETALLRDGVTSIEPAATFRVLVAARLADARLVLLDEQDALVPHEGAVEVGPSSSRYELVPREPLRTGSAYTLRLDGALEREAHDEGGRGFRPVAFGLKTTGERPSPPPKVKKAGRRRR